MPRPFCRRDVHPTAARFLVVPESQRTDAARRSRRRLGEERDRPLRPREAGKQGLKPSPPADKATLLRRASFDLTGLPPTPEEVQAFLADNSPEAFEKVVDRLLASPHYGERWGRHWLDLARYAESEGFKADETRPNAWRYRDYVIQSFNADKPYDRFVQEQIAGDELWPDDPQARVATGFNRHYPDESNARNLMQRRQEILDDITDTTGAVFLGPDLRLRPLPRSQVRSDPAGRLLPAAGVLRQHRRRRPHLDADSRRSWTNIDARSADLGGEDERHPRANERSCSRRRRRKRPTSTSRSTRPRSRR